MLAAEYGSEIKVKPHAQAAGNADGDQAVGRRN